MSQKSSGTESLEGKESTPTRLVKKSSHYGRREGRRSSQEASRWSTLGTGPAERRGAADVAASLFYKQVEERTRVSTKTPWRGDFKSAQPIKYSWKEAGKKGRQLLRTQGQGKEKCQASVLASAVSAGGPTSLGFAWFVSFFVIDSSWQSARFGRMAFPWFFFFQSF